MAEAERAGRGSIEGAKNEIMGGLWGVGEEFHVNGKPLEDFSRGMM